MSMDNEKITLTYLNEDDKAYGLAGMAISLAALDAIDRVVEVSLDSDGPMVTFAHAYYFSSNPSISPKIVWDNMLHNFYVTSAMVMGNIMSRSMVRLGSEVPTGIYEDIRKMMGEEGRDTCSLDEDEVDIIFSKTRTNIGRIFRNPRLHPAIDRFARTISRRRQLSGMEILDELRALSLI